MAIAYKRKKGRCIEGIEPVYVIYVRKSREEKDKQILSIFAQIAELKEYAKREHLEITEFIEEEKTAKMKNINYQTSKGQNSSRNYQKISRNIFKNQVLCLCFIRLFREN